MSAMCGKGNRDFVHLLADRPGQAVLALVIGYEKLAYHTSFALYVIRALACEAAVWEGSIF